MQAAHFDQGYTNKVTNEKQVLLLQKPLIMHSLSLYWMMFLCCIIIIKHWWQLEFLKEKKKTLKSKYLHIIR